MMKIKQKEVVIVIVGIDKGSIGAATKDPGAKLIDQGLNLSKKYLRANL